MTGARDRQLCEADLTGKCAGRRQAHAQGGENCGRPACEGQDRQEISGCDYKAAARRGDRVDQYAQPLCALTDFQRLAWLSPASAARRERAPLYRGGLQQRWWAAAAALRAAQAKKERHRRSLKSIRLLVLTNRATRTNSHSCGIDSPDHKRCLARLQDSSVHL